MIFDFSEVVKAGENGYAEYRIPGIVAHGGEFIMCMEARSRSGDDWGEIHILILGTDGLRYRFSYMAGDGPTLNNPTLISDRDRLHLIYHENYARAYHSVSLDNGYTWSHPVEITNAYKGFDYDWNVCATGPGHGIRLESGRLLVPVWLAKGEVAPGAEYRVCHYPSVAGALYSDDGGFSWTAGALLTDGSGVESANETSICQTGNGDILFNFRHRGSTRRRVLALSSDGGESLSDVRFEDALADPMCFGSMTALSGRAVYSGCLSETRRNHLTLFRLDGGKWTRLYKFPGEAGYSDIAVLNGRFCVLYERGEGSRIAEIVLARQVDA